MNKPLLPIMLAGMILSGVVIAWFVMQSGEAATREASLLEEARAETAQAAAEKEALEESLNKQLETLVQEKKELEKLNQKLVAENEKLVAQVVALEEPGEILTVDEAVEEGSAGPGLPVAFGAWGDLEPLLEADWEGMAGAVQRMHGMIEKLYSQILAGEEPSMEDQIAIARENQRLSQYAINVIGKLPTNQTGNGEYAHPITLSNLTAALLEESGEPLTDQQRAAMADQGEVYEEAWSRLQAGYSEDTLMMTRFMDELALKQEFMSGVKRQLTAAQIAYVTPESIADRTRLDVLSPVVMTTGKGRVVQGKDAATVKARYVKAVSDFYGIQGEQLESLDYVFNSWLTQVDPILTPRPAHGAEFYDLSTAVISGRAHAQVLRDLLASAELDEDTREKLRNQPLFAVPVIVEE